MEIIKLMTNGYPQGIYAITKKEEVIDALLDLMIDGSDDEYIKSILDAHLESDLYIVPKGEKSFDWDEKVHGIF